MVKSEMMLLTGIEKINVIIDLESKYCRYRRTDRHIREVQITHATSGRRLTSVINGRENLGLEPALLLERSHLRLASGLVSRGRQQQHDPVRKGCKKPGSSSLQKCADTHTPVRGPDAAIVEFQEFVLIHRAKNSGAAPPVFWWQPGYQPFRVRGRGIEQNC
jgi:hypothetical protein